MKFTNPQAYKNQEGKEETAKQQFFYESYLNMPPMMRTIPNLFKLLKKKEKDLPYKMVSKATLYNYANNMNWDERVRTDTYNNISTHTKDRQVTESDYAHKKAWQLMYNLYDQMEGMAKHLDWKKTPNGDSREEILNKIQTTFTQSMKTMHGAPMSLAEIYAMMEVIKATEEEGTDQLEQTDKLLQTKDDKK